MRDVVDFYPQTFQDIPKQDNPALNDGSCIMIVKESDTCPML